MKAHEDVICTLFGVTIGGWVHSLGSGLGYACIVAGLTGFISWFGAQFAKTVFAYLKEEFKKHKI